MTLDQVSDRRNEVIARELELLSKLAEARRAFHVDGISAPIEIRVTDEAELARLACEKHALNVRYNAARAAGKVLRGKHAHAHLIRLVTDAGMPELVVRAEQLADDALQAAAS